MFRMTHCTNGVINTPLCSNVASSATAAAMGVGLWPSSLSVSFQAIIGRVQLLGLGTAGLQTATEALGKKVVAGGAQQQ